MTRLTWFITRLTWFITRLTWFITRLTWFITRLTWFITRLTCFITRLTWFITTLTMVCLWFVYALSMVSGRETTDVFWVFKMQVVSTLWDRLTQGGGPPTVNGLVCWGKSSPETHVFYSFYHQIDQGFRCKFSHHPIL